MLRLLPRELPTSAIAAAESSQAESTDSAADVRMHAYLESIDLGLRGVPPSVRSDICQELRSHLEASRIAYEEMGDTTEAALEAAIERFGAATQIAKRYRSAWAAAKTDTAKAFALRCIVSGVTSAVLAMGSFNLRDIFRSESLFTFWLNWPMMLALIAVGWRYGRQNAARINASPRAMLPLIGWTVLTYAANEATFGFLFRFRIHVLSLPGLNDGAVCLITYCLPLVLGAAIVSKEMKLQRRRSAAVGIVMIVYLALQQWNAIWRSMHWGQQGPVTLAVEVVFHYCVLAVCIGLFFWSGTAKQWARLRRV